MCLKIRKTILSKTIVYYVGSSEIFGINYDVNRYSVAQSMRFLELAVMQLKTGGKFLPCQS